MSGTHSGSSPISIPCSRPSWSKNPTVRCRRFWTAIQDGLLPALAKSDTAAAAKSYTEISARYAAHRAIVDDIVKGATDQNAATEAAATDVSARSRCCCGASRRWCFWSSAPASSASHSA